MKENIIRRKQLVFIFSILISVFIFTHNHTYQVQADALCGQAACGATVGACDWTFSTCFDSACPAGQIATCVGVLPANVCGGIDNLWTCGSNFICDCAPTPTPPPSCRTCNSCGVCNSGTLDANGICSVTPPPTPAPTTCSNVCGQTATATCGATCVPPPTPAPTTCSNACGQTNTATCGTTCVPPPTPAPTTCSNICGQTATATCGSTCVPPPLPAGYGSSCTSSANACGQTSTGTIQCNGTCSASTPPLPAGYGSSCTSAPNVCGQTNTGTIDCSGSCTAATPPNSNCGVIACRANADCNDGNPCTTDVCNNPGTFSASCSNTVSGTHSACVSGACTAVANSASVCTNSCTSNADCAGPTLSVALTANPSSGTGTITSTLTATVSGTATGTVNYSFWWNCSYTGTSVTTAIGQCGDPDSTGGNTSGNKFSSVNSTSQNSVAHTYTAGSYTAKVITERDSAPPAEARRTVAVSTAICNSNADCNDGNPCTADVCNNPGTISASCSNTVSGTHSACVSGACTAVANTSSVCTNSCTSIGDCAGPTLSVALTATPPSGTGTITSTLTATVSGTATGTINYSFWWNCSSTVTDFATAQSQCGSLPAPVSGSCVSDSIGAKCDTMSVTTQAVNNTYPVGNYTAKVIVERDAAPSAQAQQTVNVTSAADFSVSMGPFNPSSIVKGQTSSSNISLQSLNGFSGTVNLTASGCPTNATCTFYQGGTPITSVTLSAGGSAAVTLTVATAISTPPNGYAISAIVTSGALSHSASSGLTVTAPAPDFFVDASGFVPATIAQGGTAFNQITIQSLNNFSGTVNLAVSGCPANATCTFSQGSLTLSAGGSAAVTLTVATATNTPTGSYTITTTGTSGALSHSADSGLIIRGPNPIWKEVSPL